MSGPVFIVGDSLEPAHPGLEVTQADQGESNDPEVEAKLEELREEARAQEEAQDEPTTENADGVEVDERDAHRDEIADDQPDAGGFSHVFGDTDTAIGGSSEQEVVSADNEQATVDAAAADAAGVDVTQNEARRQGDLENVPTDSVDEDPDGDGPQLTAAETIAKIEAADSVDAVDELASGDDRVTVQRAADKRTAELTDDES